MCKLNELILENGQDWFNNILDGCQKRERVNDVMSKEKLVLSHYFWLGIH
jgi:hypothetical protein